MVTMVGDKVEMEKKLVNVREDTWRPRAQAASALWASWWGKRSHLVEQFLFWEIETYTRGRKTWEITSFRGVLPT